MKFLFSFYPTGSFMFSGESSLQSPNKKKEGSFLSLDPHKDKRESFIVTSDKLPPQTTMMGAIRYLLLQWTGYQLGTPEAADLIGASTFDLENPSKEMGIIKEIGPVMITGKIDSKTRFLLPAPLDHEEKDVNSPNNYSPREKYDPKATNFNGFMIWSKETGELEKTLYSEDRLFASYKQALHATAEEGTQSDDKSFHMQERVRLIDKEIAPSEKGLLSNPAFCVEVKLDDAKYKKMLESKLKEKSLDNLKTFVSLGGRESTFKVKIEESAIDFKFDEDKSDSKKFYLLSPARLPANWRDKENELEMVYLNKRKLRGASTEIKGINVSLKLNANRLIFADAGSVFIFKDHDKMEKFRKKIEEDPRRICGFNRTVVL